MTNLGTLFGHPNRYISMENPLDTPLYFNERLISRKTKSYTINITVNVFIHNHHKYAKVTKIKSSNKN